jgi:methyl-accepting chemotaxis protein
MRFTSRLVRELALMIVLGTLVSWYVAFSVFPLSGTEAAALRLALLVAVPLECAVASAIVAVAARPLRRALLSGAALAPGPARRAAAAGHRLPAFTAAAVLGVGLAATVLVVAFMHGRGMPEDLAVAGAAVGSASTILAAMLAYSRAAAAAARVCEQVGGDAEVAGRGTVRGKILVLGFGLNTIGVLLFAATGYVRFRADMDREYVAAAQRAQASAIAAIGARAAPEIAEHVWTATGAPSALLSPGGLVVTRFGPSGLPFDAAVEGRDGERRLADGWLVSRRTRENGRVVSWLPEEPLWARRRAFASALLGTVFVVYAVTALLAWIAARAITLPFRTLGRAADRIAAGDLTQSPPTVSRDEMGQLAADFRRMADGLKGLVVDVMGASEGVSLGARETSAIGDRVRRGALDQHAGVVAVQAAVGAMEGSVALVSRGVGGLSEYVAATTAAVSEMASALEDVRRKGAELERAMAEAGADVAQLGIAGREAEGTLGELEGLAGHAGGTLASVRASVTALEHAAADSETTAASVAELAERAGGVVEETVHGIETLRAAVSDAHRRITSLGRRSDDIDQVVDFISEVAGRTNLLSLNASIIAAQAGEHGKAFAVVADQIRDLAAQIARSTKSIGDIIHAVREDVEGTAALIDRGDALAVEGVQLARNSLEALGRIQRSTAHARATAAAIRAAVDAHVQSSREVSQLVESVTGGTRAASQAVQLVGRSMAAVNSVSRSVGAMADGVARALEEQSGLGNRQLESLSRLERMITEITRAVENHSAATRRVRDALAALSDAAGAHDSAVDGLSGVAERLGGRAKALAERVGRFKV